MTAESSQNEMLRFGEFTLDVARGALCRGSDPIHLRPQSFAVLKYLAQNPRRLVSKEELFAAVWGNTVVTDDSLTQCLIDIRRALGDESLALIRTVPRRGVVFEMPVSIASDPAAAAPAAPGSRVSLRWVLSGALAAIAIVAWLGATRLGSETSPGKLPANTLAVLAFADLSEKADHQYFADGVAEEILNLLARVPELRVVARTSSFSFRDREENVTKIGEALDVAYLLEGSVRRAGERVRVTAQLVDASSGAHVWSENYDRDLDDLLAVQTDIAGRVVRSLEITLAEGAFITERRAVSAEAYDHYLLAQFLHDRRAPGDLALAEEHYRRAVTIAPDYAAAWAGLAGTELARILEEDAEPAAGLEAMRAAISRALELDPALPETQMRAAHYYTHAADWERAAEHHDRALALGMNSALVLASAAGRAESQGRYEEAVELLERAVGLDPLGVIVRSNYASALAAIGRYEDALREVRRAQELSPFKSGSDELETPLLALLGRHEEALATAQSLQDEARLDQVRALAFRALGHEADARKLLERIASSDHPFKALRLAELHAQWGEADAAFALMPAIRAEFDAAARTPGNIGRVGRIVVEPLLGPLHADPRWQSLLAEAQQRKP